MVSPHCWRLTVASKHGSDCVVVCPVNDRRCLALSEAVSDVVVGRRRRVGGCW